MESRSIEERPQGHIALCQALSDARMLKAFLADPEWQDVVTQEELNTPDENQCNALMLITKHDTGLRLLISNPDLRRKITAAGLCYVSENGSSAARNLLIRDEGISLFLECGDLRAKLNVKVMNKSNYDAMPLVFELTKSPEGIELLARPEIRNLISKKGLNKSSCSSSTLQGLCKSEAGIALLVDEDLVNKIKLKNFNSVNHSKRESALTLICRSATGLNILLNNRTLAKKIQTAFNEPSNSGVTPLFDLVQSETGIACLVKYRFLRRLITEEMLNETCHSGEQRGTSALYWLMQRESGRELLRRDKYLQSLITRRGIFSRLYSDGENAMTVADHFRLPDNTDLLDAMPKKILEYIYYFERWPNQTTLARQSTTGFFKKVPEEALSSRASARNLVIQPRNQN